MLDALGNTHAQLIDLGLLVGTDFHPGVNGIGTKESTGTRDALPEQSSACRVMAALERAFGAQKLF